MKQRVALSWSGGKDSCMALDILKREGYEVVCLVTTVPDEIGRTFGHGDKLELIQRQADALSIPIEFIHVKLLDHYTRHFIDHIKGLKKHYHLDAIAFGDLYIDLHRSWGEEMAEQAGLRSLFPMWMKKEESLDALTSFVHSGYKAVIIRLRDDLLPEEWLGRELDETFIEDISKKDVCPMGEAGEYHTFVYDGGLFARKVHFSLGKVLTLETTKRIEIEDVELISKVN
jgi:diphthine-ammonia ligase